MNLREHRKRAGKTDTDGKTGNVENPENVGTMGTDELTPKEKRLLIFAAVFTLAGVVLQVIRGTKFLGQLSLWIALACAGWVYLDRWAAREKRGVTVRRIAAGVLSAGCVLFALLETAILTQAHEDWTALPTDAVIVLGAGLAGTDPTPSLQLRLETAADYLAEHPHIPVVVSGGQGRDEDISEAEAMRTALLSLGVDERRILMEDKATSTKENLAYSRAVLESAGVSVSEAEIAVVTNGFHILRTRLLARRQGMNIIGVAA
ncbi:MAG: YdcF family protein, partial [Oscillibacter sp.]|nr:YdcF family protein [Oscillibacter sp.]